MPQQGADTVQVQTPDNKIWKIPKANLDKALSRGAKLYSPGGTPAPSTASTVGREAALGAFQGLGIPNTEHPIKDMVKGLLPQSPMDAMIRMNPILGPAKSVYDMVQGGIVQPAKEIKGGVKQGDAGMVAHGAAQMGTEALMALLGEKTPEVVAGKSELGTIAKPVARELLGMGEKDIAKSISDSAARVEKAKAESGEAYQKALTDHAAKVDKVLETTAKKVQKLNDARIEASKSKSAAETKQAALQTKRGPVYQRITEQADAAQKAVQTVDTKVRAVENAKWSAFDRTVKDAPVDWTPVQKAVQKAESDTLQGSPENIALFRNIMKEGTGGDPAKNPLQNASIFKGAGGVDVKEFLSSIPESKRAQFIKDMQARGETIPGAEAALEGTTVPFKDARGYYTELGEKIYGARNLPSDVRRALREVREAVDGEVTRTVAKSGGKDAIQTYRQLKSDWRDYMETFYDKDAPARKLKEGKDPNDKLNPIVGPDGARLIESLGKYRNYDPALAGNIGKLRSLHTSIKELPSAKGSVPAAVEKPKLPSAPTERPVTEQPMNAEQARLAKMQSGAASYAHPPSRWEILFPPLLAYKLALKKILQSEWAKNTLAK